MSLDEPVRQPSLFIFQGLGKEVDNDDINDRHKHDQQRQPRSPGGRLASFLSSLFSQSSSKKKKNKKSNKSDGNGGSSMLQSSSGKEHDDDPDRRRWRSSSASHFRSSSSAEVDSCSKSRAYGIGNFYCYSTRNNNNRSSTVSVTTPTKSFKELRSTSDHRQVGASNKTISSIEDETKTGSGLVRAGRARSEMKFSDIEEKGSVVELHRKFNSNINNNNNNGSSGESMSVDQAEEESDSSSDLFELQIGGEGYFSGDLPVYETTTHQAPGSSSRIP